MRTCVRVRTHARARKHAFAHSEDENDEMSEFVGDEMRGAKRTIRRHETMLPDDRDEDADNVVDLLSANTAVSAPAR